MKNFFTFLIVLLVATTPLFAASVQKMDKETLKSLLGSKNLVILDVRQGRDWSGSEYKIKDALRVDDGDLSIARTYPKESIFVLYCTWPNEATSAGLAQKLIDASYDKVYALKGGWREWYRSKYPVESK